MYLLFLAAIVVAVLITLWSFKTARQARVRDQSLPPGAHASDADACRHIREKMLTTSAESWGVAPSADFPRIHGVLMDWPVAGVVSSIFSAYDGTASLYTNVGFGVIGAGNGSEQVRDEAIRFVRLADRFHDAAVPTVDTQYPAPDRVRFYLLAYDGLRLLEADRLSLERGTSEYSTLFDKGQLVLAGIRKVYDQKQ